MSDQQSSSLSFGSDGDGNNANQTNTNALIISLYLIESADDILPTKPIPSASQSDDAVKQRARLYQRLSNACTIANNVLQNSLKQQDTSTTKNSINQYNRPWSSGGDGPIFGIHCDTTLHDEYFNTASNDVDGDDIWQSISPQGKELSSTDDKIHQALVHQDKTRKTNSTNNDNAQFQQPHLRAICHYGNDVNDMWRCISLVHKLSSTLSSSTTSSQHTNNLSCAIECWDANDGHILLIEAADHLPTWVDDDVLQGGVGGPAGCRNRCWIVDGEVHLIPPQKEDELQDLQKQQLEEETIVDRLPRRDALRTLMDSINNDEGARTAASDSVQCAIQDRMNRTDYSNNLTRRNHERKGTPSKVDEAGDDINNKDSSNNSHWHVAAVALPASVAHFIQKHPHLVPLLVNSFCEHAPTYLKERSAQLNQNGSNTTRNPQQKVSDKSNKDSSPPNNATFGTLFPYEQIVIIPITFTRTAYAELVTGRGIVPSFPIPNEYRSVELNRFQRQLRQSALFKSEESNCGAKKKTNPFQRAVDVGIRLCSGLDWIVSANNATNSDMGKSNVGKTDTTTTFGLEDSAIQTLGEVERRLRIYWTRIDAEASRTKLNDDSNNNMSTPTISWIEQAWQAGPNGSGIQQAGCDKLLLQAVETMSKCHVFNPELSKSLWEEPCPFTKPGVSLFNMAQAGIKRALKWQGNEYDEDCFPLPRVGEVDDDGWMEVNSLEELEEEMKSLSTRKVNTEVTSEGRKPRRTTRRSRRNLAKTNTEPNDEQTDEPDDSNPKEDVESLNKVLSGFKSFVESEGELEGVVTKKKSESPPSKTEQCSNDERQQSTTYLDPETLMSQEVNVNPRRFLNILHSMLSQQKDGISLEVDDDVLPGGREGHTTSEVDQDVAKYFFNEDLDSDDEMSEDSRDNGFGVGEEPDHQPHNTMPGQDPWALESIMEAMDHELRTDAASHSSIKNVSVASVDNIGGSETEDSDIAMLSNLLSSIESEGNGSGPVTNILREMGICPPRLEATDEEDEQTR